MPIRATFTRLLAMFRRRQLDADLDDEVRAHLELLAADYERRGMTNDEARHAARRQLGGAQQMKEAYWDRSGLRWLEDAQRDVHHALRTLRRRSVVRSWSVVSASRSSA
jgi:putative ABC transport system permease protein